MSRQPLSLTLARLGLLTALLVISLLTTMRIDHQYTQQLNDKLGHLLAFYVLALLADFSFPGERFGLKKFLVLLGYGLLIEVVQYFLRYRSFSLLDLLADGLGIFLYLVSHQAVRSLPLLRRHWRP